jgi:hypothetical protein
MAPSGRGEGQFAKKAPAQATAQEFVIQLATTRKMLLSVLEKHDAVPDKVFPCLVLCTSRDVFLRC